jgi:adenosylcobyric acid synthase
MSKAKLIMIQGTASSVGKSIICTALCRIFKQDGYRVAPFKAQNMALNSFVTADGGEIGRAQAVQAAAAGIPPTVDMNPVLLKPAKNGCQVIVMGKVDRTIAANDYTHYAKGLLPTVTGALERLRSEYDIVVIEGAGSPAEINLKDHEIVNMRLAKEAGAPVLLVGDIDKGGVYASLIGTLEIFDEEERHYVKGLIINKFRGDAAQLKPANDFLEKRTGIPLLGVVPWFKDIRIAQEDSVYLDEREAGNKGGGLNVTVVRLPHISNYDDFDPLELEGCEVNYVTQVFEVSNPHLIIIPGTKSTVNDLEYLNYGLAGLIKRLARAGTPVLGICGGYQMLGKKILDPHHVESEKAEVDGLGLLDVVTEFAAEKSTTQVRAEVAGEKGLLAGLKGQEIEGYEIHMGRSKAEGASNAFRVTATPQGEADYYDGALDASGKVMGTYLHGLFYNDDFRHAFVNNLRRMWNLPDNSNNSATKTDEYDKLAAVVRENLDIKRIYEIMDKGV